jgi:hypothetical protein
MFAPKVAKPETAASSNNKLAHQRSPLVAQQLGHGVVEQWHTGQRTIGNQGTQQLLAQRARSRTGPGADHEREAGPENMTAREPTRGAAWDFSRIAIFPPDRNERYSPQVPNPRPPAAAGLQPPCAACASKRQATAPLTQSRIPVYSEGAPHAAFSGARTVSLERGETIEAKPATGTKAMIGRKEYPADFVGALQPGDTRAVPHDFAGALQAGLTRSNAFHPDISVVTPGTKTGDCGANQYKVKWGIPASEKSSAGWIVQKVNETFQATDCAGKPVTPHPVDDPAGYPFWEAWEFTAGQKVWVGPAAGGAAHSGDTFGSDDYGPGTKGKATITGEVKAIVGFTLPPGMTVRNASPAWSLPYTKTEPAQFANTLGGASHTLTAEWDCCPQGTVTKATTVTTNP